VAIDLIKQTFKTDFGVISVYRIVFQVKTPVLFQGLVVYHIDTYLEMWENARVLIL
jgi:hypothetical protein